jgi:hypothetical protein
MHGNLGVPRTKSSTRRTVGSSCLTSLTPREWQILLGTLLGDSSLNYPDKLYSRSPRLSCNHCMEQQAWAIWKDTNLPTLQVQGREIENKGFGTHLWQSRSICHPDLERAYKLCYPEGKKTVSFEWLDRLGPLGMATWFMDNGCRQTGSIWFHTEGLGLDGNLLLERWFSRLGVPPKLSYYRTYVCIRFNTAETRELLRIMTPYAHVDLAYKFGPLPETSRKPDIPRVSVPEVRGLPRWAKGPTDAEWAAHVKKRTGSPEHQDYLARQRKHRALRRAASSASP